MRTPPFVSSLEISRSRAGLLFFLVFMGCASQHRFIVLSPHEKLKDIPLTKSYQDLKMDYSVRKTIGFGKDPELVKKSVLLAKQNINYEVPEKKIVFTAIVWDPPLIKAFIKDQKFNTRSSVGEEIRSRMMRDHIKYTQILLEIESYVNPYFEWGEWQIWLEDASGKSYQAVKTQEISRSDTILEVDKDILGKKTQSPAYKVFYHYGTFYFEKLDLVRLSPLKLKLINPSGKTPIEMTFRVVGTPPLYPPVEGADGPLGPPLMGPAQKPVTEKVNKEKYLKIHFNQGTAYFQKKEYEKAIEEWNKVLAIDPAHELAQMKIEKAENILEGQQALQQQISHRQKIRQMRVHFLMGSESYKAGDYEEAVVQWEEVLKLDPNHEISKVKIEKAQKKLEIQYQQKTQP